MTDLILDKGDDLPLAKDGVAVNTVTLGLGWEPAEGGDTYDLDASIAVFNGNQRVDVCYYGKLSIPGVKHSGDDLTGGNSDDGPDEVVTLDLSAIQGDRAEIIVTLYNAGSKGQNLSEVRDAFVEIGGDVNPAKFVLSDSDMQGYAMQFGTLTKQADGWHFTGKATNLGKVDLNGALRAVK